MLHLPDNADDAPTDVRRSVDVEKFVQSFLVRLLSKTREDEVENAVEHDDDKDEDVAVEFGLVNCHHEAEAFHKEGNEQKTCDEGCQSFLAHAE